MKIQISHDNFQNKLGLGEINFEYTKNDSTLREARGTTRIDLIPEGLRPAGGQKSTKGTPYFDLDINEWRSVSDQSVIVVTTESLFELPGIPSLSDAEIQYMLWKSNVLEDKWLVKFIELIWEATVQDSFELMHGKFKELIKTIKQVQEEDSSYYKGLLTKWEKIINCDKV